MEECTTMAEAVDLAVVAEVAEAVEAAEVVQVVERTVALLVECPEILLDRLAVADIIMARNQECEIQEKEEVE